MSTSKENVLVSFFKKGGSNSQGDIEMKPLQDPLLSQHKHSDSKTYDPFAYPADPKMANDHGLARRVAVPPHLYDELIGQQSVQESNEEENKAIDVCDCCGYPIVNQ